jgi:hypothetical protein
VSIEEWQAIGIVCGAILALAGVMLLIGKGLSVLWQWKFGNELKAAMARIEAKLDAHLDSHADPGEQPAKPPTPRPSPNGRLPTTGRRVRRA